MAESNYTATPEKPRYFAAVDRGPHREGKPDQWAVWERISDFGSAKRQVCADEAEAVALADQKNREEFDV